VEAALRQWFPERAGITAPGTVDGGDICEAGGHFFLGLSRRSNREGTAQLGRWLARHGFSSSVIDIRAMPGLLHLKTGLSWLGERRVLVAGELAGHEAFNGWEVVRVPHGEEYAANCIRVNGALLIARGFPATSALLGELGFELVPLDMSEYRKMDGGLSCLSVRW
jgi:dimethylargininase